VTRPGDPPAGPPPGGWLAEVKARRAGMPADPLEVVVTPAEEEYYMQWRIVEHGPPDSHGGRGRLAWFPEGEAEAAEFFVHAPADIDRLVAEVTRLRGRLGELEWAGTLQPGYACCPACESPKGFGAVPGPHEEGCWLPEVLNVGRQE
jgi:hypothetical protein